MGYTPAAGFTLALLHLKAGRACKNVFDKGRKGFLGIVPVKTIPAPRSGFANSCLEK
jgi:hypothetical protein